MDELIDDQMRGLYRVGVMHETLVRTALETVAQQAKNTIEPWSFVGRGPFIYLYKSKTKFYFFDVKPEDIHIEDIAWGLSGECRFGNHSRWYSVAEHSLNVSTLMSGAHSAATDIEYQLVGLLHDGAEAYLKDIPTPLKHTPVFKAYRELEDKIQTAIWQHFQLDAMSNGTKVLLGWADKTMLATEKHELFAPDAHPDMPNEVLPEAHPMRLSSYSPQIVYNLFMQRYNILLDALSA